jgi:hypothetical protein
MAGFLGWVTGVVADLLDWVIGVRSFAGDGAGSHLQVMEFVSVLMRFLLVCGGSGGFPLYLADKYCPCYQSPAGVQYDVGLAERLQCCFLSLMLCARNYMCLMWLDATWVGRESVPHWGMRGVVLLPDVLFLVMVVSVISLGNRVCSDCTNAFLLVVRTPPLGHGFVLQAVSICLGGWLVGPLMILPR